MKIPVKVEDEKLERRAAPGPALHFVSVVPDAPKALVGIIHGYADHAERYRHVQDAWASRAIGSVAIDLRGHGRADGPRGYCARFEEFIDDAGELARVVRDRAGDVPRFLFGHSFGGLVAARSAIADATPWKGLILSSPYFALALPVPRAKVLAGKIASVIAPRLGLAAGIRGDQLTHDAARARAYEEDPLVFKKARARWFVETQRATQAALAQAGSLSLPLYMLFGEADPILSIDAAKKFYEAAGSKNKKFASMPGLLHEILNEPSWKEIADKIADFVLSI